MIKFSFESNLKSYFYSYLCIIGLNLFFYLYVPEAYLKNIFPYNCYKFLIGLGFIGNLLNLFIYIKIDIYEKTIEIYYPFCFWNKKRLIIDNVDLKTIAIVSPFGKNANITRFHFYFNEKKIIKKYGLIDFTDDEIKQMADFFKKKNIPFECDSMEDNKDDSNRL